MIVIGQSSAYQIKWEESSKSFLKNERLLPVPTFSGAVHSPSGNFLPVYSVSLPVNSDAGAEVKIINAVFDTLNDTTILSLLQNEIVLNTYSVTDRKKHFAQVSFVPLRKNGTIVERLVSFDLLTTQKPFNSNSQRAQRAYAANSVLATGKWIKVGVSAEGIYKLDYNYLYILHENNYILFL